LINERFYQKISLYGILCEIQYILRVKELMNSLQLIQQKFALHVQGIFPAVTFSDEQLRLHLNIDPLKQEFGDFSTSIAMVLAKQLGQPPRMVAQQIVGTFTDLLVAKMEIAGPGFINIYLTDEAFKKCAQELYEQKEEFFKDLCADAPKQNYSIEFVSANPTGPLHFGHGRGGIIGDVLGNVLKFMGHAVTKEFYINDAGNQIRTLGQSFKVRCMQAAGMPAVLDENAYHGEYLLELARECLAHYDKELLEKPDQFFADYAKEKMLEQLKKTLAHYGISFDVWFSEKTLHTSGAITDAIGLLNKNGFLFEHDDALWFKTTAFGDDKDRVVKKSTGEYTYIAADVAYLKNKIDRGFDHLIFVLGHDHHSYATRLEAVKNGLGFVSTPLDVILYQLVKMSENGELVRMSKRAGAIVTLQDIIDTVGKDVARFFYLNRKADAQLEFDLGLALKKTEENPVYYVQYAYVRTGSIAQRASQEECLQSITSSDVDNIGKEEAFLLKKIMFLQQLLHDISLNHQTHLLTYYVLELAQLFHRYYAHMRILDANDIPKSRARLLMVTIVRNTLATVLKLLGVSCPDKM
jgi:arginyl-tRNA synthetase